LGCRADPVAQTETARSFGTRLIQPIEHSTI
jgi:hypothetical protein